MRALRNSAKLEVLKTLSSTGLEQSMVKFLLTLGSLLSAALPLGVLATLVVAVFVVIIFNL